MSFTSRNKNRDNFHLHSQQGNANAEWLTKLSSSWLAEKNGFSAFVYTRHHITNRSLILRQHHATQSIQTTNCSSNTFCRLFWLHQRWIRMNVCFHQTDLATQKISRLNHILQISTKPPKSQFTRQFTQASNQSINQSVIFIVAWAAELLQGPL